MEKDHLRGILSRDSVNKNRQPLDICMSKLHYSTQQFSLSHSYSHFRNSQVTILKYINVSHPVKKKVSEEAAVDKDFD